MIIGLSGSAGAGKDTTGSMLQKRFGKDRVELIAFAKPMKLFCKQVFDFSDDQCWGSLEDKKRPDPRYSRSGSREHWEQASLRLRGELGMQLCMTAAEACPGVVIYDAFSSLVSWFSNLALGTWTKDPSPLTPREALQTLGTEWGREGVHPEVWVNIGLYKAKAWTSRPASRVELVDTEAYSFNANVSTLPRIAALTDCRFVNEMKAVKEAGGCVVRLTRKTSDSIGGVLAHASEAEQLTAEAISLVDHFVDNTGTLEFLEERVCSLVDNIL